MKNKDSYITQNEIKVSNLLSDMFDNETNLLKKIKKKKDKIKKLRSELKELEKDYKGQKTMRVDLTKKFEDLKKSTSAKWEDFKSEYELILNLAEGDKTKFVEKADDFMEDLNKRIKELEGAVKKSSDKSRQKSQELLEELLGRKDVLQKKLDSVREETGEIWKEIKQSFIAGAKSIKSLF